MDEKIKRIRQLLEAELKRRDEREATLGVADRPDMGVYYMDAKIIAFNQALAILEEN